MLPPLVPPPLSSPASGVGEVIQGWDVGVGSMQKGGKRAMLVPPHLGYGRQGAPPDIPGQSTLYFEVELC